MVFPQVAATNTSTAAGTSHVVNLPTGISVDDLLLVFFATDGDISFSDLDGFTELFSKDNGTACSLSVLYKIAVGSDTLTLGTNESEGSAHVSFRITGHNTSQMPEVSTGVLGVNTNIPDPDLLTPTGGAKDYLWFAAEGNDDDDATTVYPLPDNNLTAIQTTCNIGVCSDELNQDSLNPSTFTLAANEQWYACTVVVHPAAGAQDLYEYPATTVNAEDTLSRDVAFVRTKTDTVNVADDIDLQLNLVKTLTENITASDSIAPVVVYMRELTDVVSLADELTKAIQHVKELTDNISLSDSLDARTYEWLGISSAEYDSHCGDNAGHTIEGALDGTDYWYHSVNEVHWFVLDLGQIYTIKKVRGRSLQASDPIDVNIYIDDNNPPTTLVHEGITTWQDTSSWVEIVLDTEGTGRYIKVEVEDTEYIDDWIAFGGPIFSEFTIFDAHGRVAGLTEELTESVSLSDSLTRVTTISKTLTETISVTDELTKTGVFVRALDESISLVDDLTKTIVTVKELTDIISASDSISSPSIDGWLEISSTNIDSFCGESGGRLLSEALDGDDFWYHFVEHVHWFIVDLGQTYDVKKVRGRSLTAWDPLDIDIYVSDDKEDWGTAVATGVNTWQDTDDWVEVDTTDKSGRYIKVVVNGVETLGLKDMTFGAFLYPFPIFDAYGSLATGLSKELTESISISDQLTSTVAKALSESISLIDNLTKVASLSKTLTETIAVDDTATRVQVHDDEYTEQIVASDEYEGVFGQIRTFTDGVTLSDNLTRVAVIVKQLTETISLADNLTEVATLVRELTEGVDASDSVTYNATWGLTLAETVTASDECELPANVKTLTETVTVSDECEVPVVKLLTETLSVSDTVGKEWALELTETITVRYDLVAKKPPAGGVILADTLSRSVSKTLSETINLSDIRTETWVNVLTLTEGITLSDECEVPAVKLLTETISLTDQLTKQISVSKELIESITVLDTFTRDAILVREYTEAVDLSDAQIHDTIKEFTETVALSDSLTKVISVTKEITESITLADEWTSAGLQELELTESISLSDNLSFYRDLVKVLSDSISLSDAFSSVITSVRELTESLTVTDTVAKSRVLLETFTENITVDDAYAAGRQYALTLSESMTLEETVFNVTKNPTTEHFNTALTFDYIVNIVTTFDKILDTAITLDHMLVTELSYDRILAITITVDKILNIAVTCD